MPPCCFSGVGLKLVSHTHHENPAFNDRIIVEEVLAPSTLHHREFLIDNLLVQIHLIIVMIRWTGLAAWEFEYPFSDSLTSRCGVSHTHHENPAFNDRIIVEEVSAPSTLHHSSSPIHPVELLARSTLHHLSQPIHPKP